MPTNVFWFKETKLHISLFCPSLTFRSLFALIQNVIKVFTISLKLNDRLSWFEEKKVRFISRILLSVSIATRSVFEQLLDKLFLLSEERKVFEDNSAMTSESRLVNQSLWHANNLKTLCSLIFSWKWKQLCYFTISLKQNKNLTWVKTAICLICQLVRIMLKTWEDMTNLSSKIKIAVCGKNSVGKSGKFVYGNWEDLNSTLNEIWYLQQWLFDTWPKDSSLSTVLWAVSDKGWWKVKLTNFGHHNRFSLQAQRALWRQCFNRHRNSRYG